MGITLLKYIYNIVKEYQDEFEDLIKASTNKSLNQSWKRSSVHTPTGASISTPLGVSRSSVCTPMSGAGIHGGKYRSNVSTPSLKTATSGKLFYNMASKPINIRQSPQS